MYCCSYLFFYFFFFKQKTAYEMRISDWSSDVCSSDLLCAGPARPGRRVAAARRRRHAAAPRREGRAVERRLPPAEISVRSLARGPDYPALAGREVASRFGRAAGHRSEEHTSELQSLMRISYAVFCLKNKTSKPTLKT